jgi:hypothetical protein
MEDVMSQAASEERAVVLEDWPQPAGVPEPKVLADDLSLSLLYRTGEDRIAVVRFPTCHYLTFGEPNDEALGGHPLSKRGLRYYSVHEILESSLIRELERRNSVHPGHNPDWYIRGMRHYVFTFQDSTLECVVGTENRGAPSIEVFDREDEAKLAWLSANDR